LIFRAFHDRISGGSYDGEGFQWVGVFLTARCVFFTFRVDDRGSDGVVAMKPLDIPMRRGLIVHGSKNDGKQEITPPQGRLPGLCSHSKIEAWVSVATAPAKARKRLATERSRTICPEKAVKKSPSLPGSTRRRPRSSADVSLDLPVRLSTPVDGRGDASRNRCFVQRSGANLGLIGPHLFPNGDREKSCLRQRVAQIGR
jgi:hypothetical protein